MQYYNKNNFEINYLENKYICSKYGERDDKYKNQEKTYLWGVVQQWESGNWCVYILLLKFDMGSYVFIFFAS